MKHVLVIDDELQIRDMLKKLLERAGYAVSVAENGSHGLKLFQATHFDIVITDLTMPEKDGMETIKEILAERPDMPIVAMSGGGHRFPEYFLPKAHDAGARTCLRKPFRGSELIKVVAELTVMA